MKEEKKQDIYDIELKTIDGTIIKMSDYKNKVLLIVNTASRCGFTYQYEGLEKLYKKYREKGFEILGFPCNQFMNQEPGDENEIKKFCMLKFDVTFQLFSKIEVNGKNTHPLYKYLKENSGFNIFGNDIKWNFTKFLLDRNGKVVKRFEPVVQPEKIEKYIIDLLEK